MAVIKFWVNCSLSEVLSSLLITSRVHKECSAIKSAMCTGYNPHWALVNECYRWNWNRRIPEGGVDRGEWLEISAVMMVLVWTPEFRSFLSLLPQSKQVYTHFLDWLCKDNERDPLLKIIFLTKICDTLTITFKNEALHLQIYTKKCLSEEGYRLIWNVWN